MYVLLPFVAMLAAIAALPLSAPAWWEPNRNKLLVSCGLGLPILALYLRREPFALVRMGEEYVSFILLLASLYVISGGILLRGDLEARDSNGRRWTAERLRPESNANPGLSSVIWTGEVPALIHRSDIPPSIERGGLYFEFFADVEIPCNQRTEATTSIAGAQTSKSWMLNVAKFTACGYEFLVKRDEGCLSVEATAPGPAISPHLDLRITEALQFVLAARSCGAYKSGLKALPTKSRSGVSRETKRSHDCRDPSHRSHSTMTARSGGYSELTSSMSCRNQAPDGTGSLNWFSRRSREVPGP